MKLPIGKHVTAPMKVCIVHFVGVKDFWSSISKMLIVDIDHECISIMLLQRCGCSLREWDVQGGTIRQANDSAPMAYDVKRLSERHRNS